MAQGNSGSNSEEYERAILWVPDPTSPAGWIRRKVWPNEEEARPKRQKPPMGFAYMNRRPSEEE